MERPPVPEDGGGKHRQKDEWGPRSIIALVVIVMSFGLAALHIFTGSGDPEASIPAWVAALIGGIGIYYYKNGKDE